MIRNLKGRQPIILILRLFIAQFWLLQFYFKLHDPKTGSIGLRNLGVWAHATADDFAKTTPLPTWAVFAYVSVVPYLELLIGIAILFGIQTRRVLFFAMLLLISLCFGLMLQGKHDVVALNTIQLFVLLLAFELSDAGPRARLPPTIGPTSP